MSGVLRLTNDGGGSGRSTIVADADSDQTFRLPEAGGTLLTSNYSVPGGTITFDGSTINITNGDLNVDSGTLFVDESTDRVGIGTVTPSVKLHITSTDITVYSPSGPFDTAPLLAVNNGDTVGSFSGLRFVSTTAGNNGAGGIYTVVQDTNGNASLTFVTRNNITGEVEVGRFNSNGFLGVGTDNPYRKLHLEDAGDTAILLRTTAATANAEIFEIGVGANTSNEADLTFRTRDDNGTGGQEVGRFLNNGNIGFGTSAPTSSAGYTTLAVGTTGSGSAGQLELGKGDGSGRSSYIFYNNAGLNIYNGFADNLIFSTNNATRMTVSSTGKVVVGSSASAETSTTKFSVTGGIGFTAGAAGIFRDQDANGVVSGTDCAYLFFGFRDSKNLGSISAWTDGAATSTSTPGELRFATTATGAVTPTSRYKIRAAGDWQFLNNSNQSWGQESFYTFNDSSVHQIAPGINNSHYLVAVTGTGGRTIIPVFGNGGTGVGWKTNILNPDSGTWVYFNSNGQSFTWQDGSGYNIYSFSWSLGNGRLSIQRVGGSSQGSYTVQLLLQAG